VNSATSPAALKKIGDFELTSQIEIPADEFDYAA